MSGVTVQDGKYVFVRGLGERYTTTSLNGARIPSPEPERKVVPLDLFPSSLLEGITTSKTFTPEQPGRLQRRPGRPEDPGVPGPPRRDLLGLAPASTTRPPARTSSRPRPWATSGSGFAGRARDLPAQRGAAPGTSAASTQAGAEQPHRLVPQRLERATTATATPERRRSACRSAVRTRCSASRSATSARSATRTTRRSRRDETKGAGQARCERRDRRAVQHLSRLQREQQRALGRAAQPEHPRRRRHQALASTTPTPAAPTTRPRTSAGFNEEFSSQPSTSTRLTFIERAVRSNQLLGEHLLGPAQLRRRGRSPRRA